MKLRRLFQRCTGLNVCAQGFGRVAFGFSRALASVCDDLTLNTKAWLSREALPKSNKGPSSGPSLSFEGSWVDVRAGQESLIDIDLPTRVTGTGYCMGPASRLENRTLSRRLEVFSECSTLSIDPGSSC